MTSYSAASVFHAPRLTSTVVPGQLPICAFAPVKLLNSVDLPEFGAPTTATTGAPSFAGAPPLHAWQLGVDANFRVEESVGVVIVYFQEGGEKRDVGDLTHDGHLVQRAGIDGVARCASMDDSPTAAGAPSHSDTHSRAKPQLRKPAAQALIHMRRSQSDGYPHRDVGKRLNVIRLFSRPQSEHEKPRLYR